MKKDNGDNGLDGSSKIDEEKETKQMSTAEWLGISPAEQQERDIINEEGNEIRRRYSIIDPPIIANIAGQSFGDYIYWYKYLAIMKNYIYGNKECLARAVKAYRKVEPSLYEPEYESEKPGAEMIRDSLDEIFKNNPSDVKNHFGSVIEKLEPKERILNEAEKARIDPTEAEDPKLRLTEEEVQRIYRYKKFKETVIKPDYKDFAAETDELDRAYIEGRLLDGPAEAVLYRLFFAQKVFQILPSTMMEGAQAIDGREKLLELIAEGLYMSIKDDDPKKLKGRRQGDYVKNLFMRVVVPKEGEEVRPIEISETYLPRFFGRLIFLKKVLRPLLELISEENTDALKLKEKDLEKLLQTIKKRYQEGVVELEMTQKYLEDIVAEVGLRLGGIG